jgi:hypothetical protein
MFCLAQNVGNMAIQSLIPVSAKMSLSLWCHISFELCLEHFISTGTFRSSFGDLNIICHFISCFLLLQLRGTSSQKTQCHFTLWKLIGNTADFFSTLMGNGVVVAKLPVIPTVC